MKKQMLATLILIFVTSAAKKVYAEQDGWGSERPAMWRSSHTQTSDGFTLIATTGAVHLHMVIVGTPTWNVQNSFVAVFNSTTASADKLGFSTACTIQTGVWSIGTTGVTQLPNPVAYDMYLSSGLVINKQGTADVNITWDYVNPSQYKRSQKIFTQ